MAVSQRYMRHSSLMDIEAANKLPIEIVGAGAIGSFTTVAMAKMGFETITVHDDDFISEHNIANQFYPVEAVGNRKVLELRDVVKSFAGVNITADYHRVNTFATPGVAICAVDSMDVRIELWNNTKKANVKPTLYIDARMGAEVIRLYAVHLDNEEEVKKYEATLYTSKEADPVRCTAKTIMYTVLTVSSFIAALLKKHIQGEEMKFETIYDCKNFILM